MGKTVACFQQESIYISVINQFGVARWARRERENVEGIGEENGYNSGGTQPQSSHMREPPCASTHNVTADRRSQSPPSLPYLRAGGDARREKGRPPSSRISSSPRPSLLPFLLPSCPSLAPTGRGKRTRHPPPPPFSVLPICVARGEGEEKTRGKEEYCSGGSRARTKHETVGRGVLKANVLPQECGFTFLWAGEYIFSFLLANKT